MAYHVGMDYAPFKIPSQMAGDFSYRSVIPSAQKVPFAAGYLLVNAGMTPPLRYQLFAGCARVQIPF